MPVRIVRQESQSSPVEIELVISTIETNRERVRTIGNMMITATGILTPVCLAFLLFFIDKGFLNVDAILLILCAVSLFLVALCLSIVSSFLRNKYLIVDEAQFVESLLTLLNTELRIARWSFATLVLGLLSMIAGVLAFVVRYWR